MFAVFKGEELIAQWRCKAVIGRTSDEYAVWLERLFEQSGLHFKDIDDAIFSSVVPDMNADIINMCSGYLGVQAISVTSDMVKGELDIHIDQPEELGADRIVNSVSCLQQYGVPAIILDFGTATTLDVLDDSGAYIGGIIAPGVKLSMQALYDAAAKLPKVDIQKPGHIVGTSTREAMYSGLYWGYVSMINGLIEKIIQEQSFVKPQIIGTGGLASMFEESLSQVSVVDESLTLKGLNMIYRSVKNLK